MSKENKIIPELRFPKFKNDEEWNKDIVDNLVLTITPPKKLSSSNYQENGKYPIIDQSKNYYCGWTNDNEAIITNDLPLIIFGDHTCIIKIAKEPFAQGADGIKILKAKDKIFPEYLFHYLKHNEVVMEDYKRHYSILKDKVVVYPNIDSGEQQKIASCLSSLDEVITAQSQKLEHLKDHKKGLMQNLFPQEGEKVPKYRFKEFEKDGEWSLKQLGVDNLIEIKGRIGYRGYTTEDIVSKGEGAISMSPSNIDENWNLDFEKSTYITWEKYEESPEIMLEDGFTVLVKTGSSYGKAAYIKNLVEKTTINPQLVVLKPKKLNSYFLYLLVTNSAVQKQIQETVVGGAIPTLSQDSISKFEVLVPKPKEQQKIAECFSALNELIILQTQRIEQLKLHKKGLMQSLFPKTID